MSNPQFRTRRFFVMDVDGVMTDGGIYCSDDGREFKKFNAKDGVGVKRLMANGIEVGIISAATSTALVQKRACMLGIGHVYAGTEPKLRILTEWCATLEIDLAHVVYVGDDLPDLEVMQAVGLAVCPVDAIDAVKNIAHLVLQRKGGDGCIRELVDRYWLPALAER